MSRLPAVTSQAMMKVLEKRGFMLDRVKGSHYIYYHPDTKLRVTVPYHHGDLKRPTLRSILREAGIRPEELRDLL